MQEQDARLQEQDARIRDLEHTRSRLGVRSALETAEMLLLSKHVDLSIDILSDAPLYIHNFDDASRRIGVNEKITMLWMQLALMQTRMPVVQRVLGSDTSQNLRHAHSYAILTCCTPLPIS